MRMTALDREPRKAEYTDLLADEQAGGDAEWHRLHQRLQIHAGKRHTGVGKTEDRNDQERNPGVQAMFKPVQWRRSEEHTSELQSLMRIAYAVFCMKKKN